MGPDTGRCRRTDGKLWRCRKDVVPGNKYCEGHMHRGRPRKRVQASEVTLQSNLQTGTCSNSHTPTSTCSVKTSQKIKSHNLSDTSAKFSTPIPESHQNKNPSPSRSKDLTNTATTITTSLADDKSKLTNTCVKNDECSSRESSDRLDGGDSGADHIKVKNKEDSTNGDKHGCLVAPEPNSSVKNIVYDDTVVVNSNAVCKNGGITVEEPQRCKRTDGKRWRCSKEAMPQKKYCGSHINRGTKRCRSSSEIAIAATLVTLKNDHTNLNTDLSILHAKCPTTVIDVESSTSGSK
ncbi:growth-regulating factor 9-like [Apium graveolens]|uniref:growth-regulating factor 9-like n=1 Tax=Apium graveolens TaxID=4045 RepID=UPI003D795EFE